MDGGGTGSDFEGSRLTPVGYNIQMEEGMGVHVEQIRGDNQYIRKGRLRLQQNSTEECFRVKECARGNTNFVLIKFKYRSW